MEQSGEGLEIDTDIPIAQVLELIRKQVHQKKPEKAKKRTVDNGLRTNESIILEETTTSVYSNSAEDYLTYINAVSVLCEDLDMLDFDPAEVERFSSSISFVRDWRLLNYPSRAMRFACENESMVGKDVIDEMILPSLSSAIVPKKRMGNREVVSSAPSNDFVLHVGGSVWALDWCPSVESSSQSNISREFIAVSTHPSDSPYHKLGERLEGRGVVQIWCLLHTTGKDGEPSLFKKIKKKDGRGRPRKQPLDQSTGTENSKKPKGRPRKKTLIECNIQSSQTLDVQCLGEPSYLLSLGNDGEPSLETSKKQKGRGRPRKNPLDESAGKEESKKSKVRPRKKPLIEYNIQSSQTLDGQCHGDPSNLLSLGKDGDPSLSKTLKKQKGRGRHRKQPLDESAGEEGSMNPEGRPSKKPSIECNGQSSQNLDVQCLGKPCDLFSLGVVSASLHEQVPGKGTELHLEATENNSISTGANVRKSRYKVRKKAQVPKSTIPICMVDEGMEFSDPQMSTGFIRMEVGDETAVGQAAERSDMRKPPPDPLTENGSAAANHFYDNRLNRECIPKDVSLPRMVLCLSHNGKVAWDVKWRPSAVYNQQRMGYLAVLLGNGALEVWDVPLPCTVQVIYRSCQESDIDPRFLKLKPVFRCSSIKFGNRHCIPLTLEWSTSSPYDMILAGCHDGTVALWKFCASGSSADTRPLVCFSADSVPIRAISWAPTESVSESANVIVTAGHKGLKFWDIRDPFKPLWDFPVQRIIYSLDWLSDPRCLIISLDDGSLRILSLANASNNLPATGARFTGTPQQGFFSYMCSLSPIWSIHASNQTGMVAYCGADGTALRFQMTQRAVGKDPHRNRAPHFLCGSVIKEEDSFLTIFTPVPNTPFPMRKSLNEWGDTPRSMRGFLWKYGNDKRAKSNNNSDSNNLPALCYKDEEGTKDGYDNTKKKKVKNEKLGNVGEKTEAAEKRGKEEEEEENDDDDDDDDDMGSLPPKVVAMHRVRWNKNKGSENWLCYGGAAGILRCQAVTMFGG